MKTQERVPTRKCKACGKRFTGRCKVCDARTSRARYLRNRDRVLARGVEYRKKNKEHVKTILADWYQRNREKVLKKTSEYQQTPEVKAREKIRRAIAYAARRGEIQASRKVYYEAHPEAKKANWEKHYAANKHKYLAARNKRIADKKKATPKWADLKAIRAVYLSAEKLKRETGIEYHVDHIVPLGGITVCGLHVANNLQVLPAKENLHKANKFSG